jgi:hypothetical protein
VEEKYLIATSEQPIAAYHRYSELHRAISVLLSPLLIFLFTLLIVLVYPVACVSVFILF